MKDQGKSSSGRTHTYHTQGPEFNLKHSSPPSLQPPALLDMIQRALATSGFK